MCEGLLGKLGRWHPCPAVYALLNRLPKWTIRALLTRKERPLYMMHSSTFGFLLIKWFRPKQTWECENNGSNSEPTVPKDMITGTQCLCCGAESWDRRPRRLLLWARRRHEDACLTPSSQLQGPTLSTMTRYCSLLRRLLSGESKAAAADEEEGRAQSESSPQGESCPELDPGFNQEEVFLKSLTFSCIDQM